jgi:hypothetical protein
MAVLTEAACLVGVKTPSAGSGGVIGRHAKPSCMEALEEGMAAESGIRYRCLRCPIVKMAFSKTEGRGNRQLPREKTSEKS